MDWHVAFDIFLTLAVIGTYVHLTFFHEEGEHKEQMLYSTEKGWTPLGNAIRRMEAEREVVNRNIDSILASVPEAHRSNLVLDGKAAPLQSLALTVTHLVARLDVGPSDEAALRAKGEYRDTVVGEKP